MRIHKALPLAAVLCAIAIAAVLAVVAGAATGPPAINDALTNLPPATAGALAPANTLAPANEGVGFCGTGVGEQCAVEWIMSKGTATATSYGSGPEGPVDGNPAETTCSSSTCTKRAVATPPPDVIVEDWIVTGPNISVICAGPTWEC
jgi:hypothetical protein